MAAAKILVVEDEGLTALEIQRKLRKWGYDVPAFAFSCEEAVRKAKEIEPDLILMDIMLKGEKDGVDAAKEIKSIRNIPIIYLTAFDDANTRKRAEITRPHGYLIKPFLEDELHNEIEKALSEHKLKKKLSSDNERDNELNEGELSSISMEMPDYFASRVLKTLKIIRGSVGLKIDNGVDSVIKHSKVIKHSRLIGNLKQ